MFQDGVRRAASESIPTYIYPSRLIRRSYLMRVLSGLVTGIPLSGPSPSAV
jgi:hypothetical protein